jgi:hypothetical protein
VAEVVGDRRRVAAALSVAAAAVLVVAGVGSAGTRDQWREGYPGDVAAVNAFFADSGGGAVLTDWMWWREWTVALYAIGPGGEVCNYALCRAPVGEVPPSLTAGLTDAEVERLAASWRFLDSGEVRFIVMLDDLSYAEWLTWEVEGNPEVLSSFVRPLLAHEGVCFTTTAGLQPMQFCPVVDHGRFVVLERSKSGS